MRQDRTRESYLGGLALNSVHNCLECRFGEAAFDASLLLVLALETGSHPFGAIIESIAERLVNGLDVLTTSHEDLTAEVSKRFCISV